MHVKDSLKYLDFAPIITVSALSGQRLTKVFDLIDNVYEQYTKRVPTALLNTKLAEFTERLSPPRYRNRPNKINYATQISVKPPTFVFLFANQRLYIFPTSAIWPTGYMKNWVSKTRR